MEGGIARRSVPAHEVSLLDSRRPGRGDLLSLHPSRPRGSKPHSAMSPDRNRQEVRSKLDDRMSKGLGLDGKQLTGMTREGTVAALRKHGLWLETFAEETSATGG